MKRTNTIFVVVIGLIIAISIFIFSGIALYQSGYYAPFHKFGRFFDTSFPFSYRLLHRVSAIACVALGIFGVYKIFFKKKNEKEGG